MKKKIPALAICLAIALSACGPKAPAPEPSTGQTAVIPAPSTTVAVAAPTASAVIPSPTPQQLPAPVWTESNTPISPKAGDGTELLRYTMSVPAIANAAGIAAYEAINLFYEQIVLEFQLTAEEQRAWAQDDYAASQSSGFPFQPYVEEYTYTISRQTDRFVSFCRDLYANEGGPYPSTYRIAEQFALDTGKQLAFADFFSDPDGAIAQIKQELVAQNAAAPDAGISEDALLAAFQPERFYLSDDGFVFFIQGEELGPFHSPIEYIITYDKLEAWTVEWIKN